MLLLLLLSFLWVRPSAAVEGLPDYTGRRVAAVQIVGPASAGNIEELSRFLEIRKGDVYSVRKVRRTIEVLAKLGNYSRIAVEAVDTDEGVVLTVRLEPVPRIRKISIKGVSGSKSRVLNALGVGTGDLYSGREQLERMKEDVADAYRRSGWRDVRITLEVRAAGEAVPGGTPLEEGHGDVTLEVLVEEGKRQKIQEVHFEGDEWQDVFDEATLVAETGLVVGEAATDGAIERAQTRLIAYLRKLDFLEARIVRVIRQRDDETGNAIIRFFFSPGERITVTFDKKAIAWADQKRHLFWFWEFRDSRLLALLELDQEAHFTEGFAQEASDRLEAYYQRRGYYETDVTPSFEEDKAKRLKAFTFKIRPGRRFRLKKVVFRGIEDGPPEVSRKAVMREFYGFFPALEDHHYVPDEVDSAVYHVTNYIRSQGFDGARIVAEEPVIDRTKRAVELEFDVTLGPRSIVGAVAIEGDSEAPESKLRAAIAEPPMVIKEGSPLNAVYLDRAEQAIEDYYARIGFPYAEARHELSLQKEPVAAAPQVDPVTGEPALVPEPPPAKDERLVDVAFHVDESFQAYVGRVIVKGNRYTNREAIERVLPFKTGQTYTPEALAEGQDALYRLGPFARVSVVPTEEGEPERVRDILVSVAEANRMVLEPSIGVSWPEQGPRVGLRAQHRNLFGNGESLSLRASANWRWTGLLGETEGVNRVSPAVDYNQIEQRVLLTYAQPTTFGFPVNGSVTASLFEREQNRAFGFTGNRVVSAADQKIDIDLPVFRGADVRLVGRYQMFLRDIQYESRRQERAVAIVEEDLTFDVGEMFHYPLKWKIASASFGTLVDGRDDRVNPTSGYTLTVNGEVADEWLASDADYARVLGSWTLFRPAPWRFAVALSVRGGYARPVGRSRGIPVDQRFHLGGTGSVRGFRESEIGPKFVTVGQTEDELERDVTISPGGDLAGSYALELRHRLIGGLDWVLFTDAGWSRLEYREPEPLDPDLIRGRLRQQPHLATSIGLGIRVKTLVGPIKFDLGIDTRELEQLRSINGTRKHVLIHFTIGDF